jgi:hypothetical protein
MTAVPPAMWTELIVPVTYITFVRKLPLPGFPGRRDRRQCKAFEAALAAAKEEGALCNQGLEVGPSCSASGHARSCAADRGVLLRGSGLGELSTLGFDPARYQTEPPACYRET